MKYLQHILLVFLVILSLNAQSQKSIVSRIIDGDTFETNSGEKVRLVGINAPEISDIYGEEAKKYLSELISEKEIDLITDKISNNQDRYNRSLRYVYLNGIDINKKMISEGYAVAYLKFKFEKLEDYRNEQLLAMKADRGMWNNTLEKKEEINTNLTEKSMPFFTINKEVVIVASISLLLIIGLFYYFKKD